MEGHTINFGNCCVFTSYFQFIINLMGMLYKYDQDPGTRDFCPMGPWIRHLTLSLNKGSRTSLKV